MARPDVRAQLQACVQTCGECGQLDPNPIDSGIRYCWGEMSWRFPAERVEGCVYRGRRCRKLPPVVGSRAAAIRDLLDDPRHTIADGDRRWLRKELRLEEGR